MNAPIRVLLFPIGKPHEIRQISGLKDLQALVGGWVDHCVLDRGVHLYCDEDGIAKRLPVNLYAVGPTYRGAVIHGPAVVCGFDAEGEDLSLTDEQIAKWSNLLRLEEVEAS